MRQLDRRRYTSTRYYGNNQQAYDSHTGMWIAIALAMQSEPSHASGATDQTGIGGGSSSSYDSDSSSSSSGSDSGGGSGGGSSD